MTNAISRNIRVGVVKETTEGTFVQSTAEDMVEVVDLPNPSPARENLDRGLFKGSIGRQKPLKGTKAGTIELKTEFRAAGVTGSVSDEPENSVLLEGAMGKKRHGINALTDSGSTDTIINLTDGGSIDYRVAGSNDIGLRVGAADNIELAAEWTQTGARTVRSVFLRLKQNGTVACGKDLTVEIQGDSGGSPDGSALTNATATVVASSVDDDYAWVEFEFAGEVSLSDATTYYIVLSGDYDVSATNFISWRSDTVTSGGNQHIYDASWAAVSTESFETYMGTGLGDNEICMIDGEVRFIASISELAITLDQALAKGAPSASETVYGGWTYKLTSDSHPSLSVSVFKDASQCGKDFQGIGCRVSNMAIEDFTVGQIPKLGFTMEMLNYDEQIAAEPANIVPESQTPPPVIQGLATKDAAAFEIGTFEYTQAQTISRELDVNTAGGVRRMLVTDREITGTVNPFQDKTTTTFFDEYEANTSVAMKMLAGLRDSSDDFIQGTVVGVYLPQNIWTEYNQEDVDGSLAHSLGYKAHESAGGPGDDEAVIGII